MNVRDMLLHGSISLTPSEERIVQVLLTDYPAAGLGTATSLAKRAGVSDPTVVRLAMKLGFEGFPALQRRLLADVEARLHSPLLMMEAKRPDMGTDSEQGAAIAYMHSVASNLNKALTSTPLASYQRAARLIMDTKGKVVLLGGRYSRFIAGMLAAYLLQFRPDIMHIDALSAQKTDLLVDLGKRDLLIVFDYRRYQLDVVAFAQLAAARRVRILLFTDPWLSPISEFSELTLTCPIEVNSPYDTMASSVAQIEAVIAQILASMEKRTRERIEELEEIRLQASASLDNARLLEDEKPALASMTSN
ncbi:MAG: MurR/RpiR family transcriptional regulator [Mesorhizobium sp.]|uniref:MurR/RpiR family transcriptional regulator n=1 Tax=Mesorhizobium sp. TaxID=1871066 RepID=UPI000FD57E3A|nr:MurR/RpiR family transcriptional regulator [Mesorhizobium sp.]RVC59418.1 MurR/RpiR family transcriptional regulator [Mesorhizobium sp. M00.F.Ca.ET.038.03.1.1]RWD29496.1 MAG: MurR/RpiR family transcriptional regulator [Mesorhizobium sp.]